MQNIFLYTRTSIEKYQNELTKKKKGAKVEEGEEETSKSIGKVYTSSVFKHMAYVFLFAFDSRAHARILSCQWEMFNKDNSPCARIHFLFTRSHPFHPFLHTSALSLSLSLSLCMHAYWRIVCVCRYFHFLNIFLRIHTQCNIISMIKVIRTIENLNWI